MCLPIESSVFVELHILLPTYGIFKWDFECCHYAPILYKISCACAFGIMCLLGLYLSVCLTYLVHLKKASVSMCALL